jgi:hypothetical protein
VNTPILTWAYTRTLKERGRRDESSDISVDSPIQRDADYLNQKFKKGVMENIDGNHKHGKVENEFLKEN